MPTSRLNVLILTVLCLLTAGVGTYLTFFVQPGELSRLDEAEKALAAERSELLGLTTSEGRMRQEIQYASQRWQARYKNVEDSLSTADVIEYVNRFAESGFDMLNVEFGGHHHGVNHHYYAFQVQGSGPFGHLYNFLWQMENNRSLYRIEDLVVDDAQVDSSLGVQFSFRLLAYFNVPGSRPGIELADASAIPAMAVSLDEPMVPEDVLPARRLPVNPFAGTRSQAAGSSQTGSRSGLVSLRSGRLVSIAGTLAAFEIGGKIRQFRVGDKVREGEITEVSAARHHVSIVDAAGATHIVKMDMSEPAYRLSKGTNRIVPVG